MPRVVSIWALALALSPASAFAADSAPATAARPASPNPRFTGLPFVTAWNADDYGAGSINYATVQHPLNGFIYVANNFGVLEFDGAAWRLVRSGNNDVVPIVVIDPRGAVWLGGSNEVAVLRPDDRGELRAHDVTARLPAAERNFGRLYLGAAAPHGVYLAGPSRLLFFGLDGTARSWRPGPTNINGLHWHDGALHVSLGSGGLARLENDTLVPAAPAPRSLNPALRDTLRLLAIGRAPAGPGSLLLTNLGPLRWAGPGAPLAPFSPAATAEFAGESATAAAFLPDGRFAFAFPRRGLLILAADGTVSALFDRARGFDGSRIEHLATDNQGGLWLARLTGLDFAVFQETVSGQGLDHHFAEKAAVIGRPWDRVVMQSHSLLNRAQPGDPALLIRSAAQVAALLHEKNPRVDIRLIATWPRADHVYPAKGHWHGKSVGQMALDVRAAYDRAAAGSPHIRGVIPVGEAWIRAMQTGVADPNPYDGIAFGQVSLWTHDHYHGSTYGYYLEALMIFGDVTGLDPRSLGKTERVAYELGVSPAEAAALQQVAHAELAAMKRAHPLAPFTPLPAKR